MEEADSSFRDMREGTSRCARFTRAPVLKTFAAGSTAGIYEASRLPTGLRVTEFDVDNDAMFVNVNTPHDYERAKELIE